MECSTNDFLNNRSDLSNQTTFLEKECIPVIFLHTGPRISTGQRTGLACPSDQAGQGLAAGFFGFDAVLQQCFEQRVAVIPLDFQHAVFQRAAGAALALELGQ